MINKTYALEKLSTLKDVQERYQWFEEMRDQQPLWLDERSGCWHVFRYDDASRVMTDTTFFSSENRRNRLIRSEDTGRRLIEMDPPDHRQYRNLVSPSFTPHALARLSGRIKEIVQELLDQVRANGSMDFVADFAYPLPTIVIAEMLGVPTTDRFLFKKWADTLLSIQLSDGDFAKQSENVEPSEDIKRVQQAFGDMSDYFKQMLKERQQQPREDMITELQRAEIDGKRLEVNDVVNFCTLLLLAGHVTTTNLLQHSIVNFDQYPEAKAQLQQQPELMPKAIEEVLRYSSPVWRITRRVKADVTIADTTVPADSIIFSWVASANRDKAQFHNPEKFDIMRSPNRHVAFGHGIHFCIGAPLSRLEAGIALPMILEQLPDLHIERQVPLEIQNSRILFGFKRLPVTFTT